MQIIKKLDCVLISVRNKYKAHRLVTNLTLVIIYLAFIAYYLILIFPLPSTGWMMKNEFIWYKIYEVLNPFTVCAYLVGLVVLGQYVISKNPIIRILASMFYGIIIFFSLIIIMGMTKLWELSIFIPHVLIISMCIVILFRDINMSEKEDSV